MIKEAIPRFDELSSAEKLLLLEELWDNLAGEPSEVPVADWQKQELERRYQEYVKNPSEGSSWSEVRERLLGALR
jgi:putative addiction module component (TIGR02574 family)